jgi:hypothetical protein
MPVSHTMVLRAHEVMMAERGCGTAPTQGVQLPLSFARSCSASRQASSTSCRADHPVAGNTGPIGAES